MEGMCNNNIGEEILLLGAKIVTSKKAAENCSNNFFHKVNNIIADIANKYSA